MGCLYSQKSQKQRRDKEIFSDVHRLSITFVKMKVKFQPVKMQMSIKWKLKCEFCSDCFGGIFMNWFEIYNMCTSP